ncbi:DMT family transporter [Paracoccus alkenifer]|uniref:EamA-like transporter family protein n=1 Tax=Paracoccus alkenifer TaxID=65735 RepID=A0A1H6MQX6_9RHOB|nr:DMT family transporter [Paracoccus alkenifer]SEI04306.1 EamA-like transporter family protein [Paracoccus alkenifer]
MGILLKLGSVVLFTGMAAILKATAVSVPPGEQMFFRSLFGVPLILAWLAWRGDLATGLRTRNPMSHALRGIIGTISMGCIFGGLGLLPFPEATALGYAMPLMIVIFAAMFLDERVGIFRLGMVALGLVGVLIVLSPQLSVGVGEASGAQTLGAMLTLTGASFGALAQIFISRMVVTEKPSAVAFWFLVTSTVLSLVTLPFGWVMPDAGTAALLVAAGFMGGAAQVMLTSSYRFADASLVAPFDYASMLLAMAIGWFVFAEPTSGRMLAGAAVIIAAGVAIILRERQLGINRAQRAGTPR